jgi:hypothetical protein
MSWDWGYTLVGLAFIGALVADDRWSGRAGWGSIVILGATAIVVVAYTAQTRRLAEETQKLAKETQSLATSTKQLAGEAPLRHALWSKRLDCYFRISGVLRMYAATSGKSPFAARDEHAEDLARAWSEALILFPGAEDPACKALLSELPDFMRKKSPTLDEIAEALAHWRNAARKSLGLPELERGIPDSPPDVKL